MLKWLPFFPVILSTLLYGAPLSFNQITNEAELSRFIEQLPLPTKVGQLFMVALNGEILDEPSQDFLNQTLIGNVVYFNWSNQLSSLPQVQKLSQQITQHILDQTSIPPLIAIDQEGGVVTRLNEPFTVFPGNMALGATDDPQLAYQAGQAMAQQMRQCGINTTFAPVVDVNDNPKNPIIGVRSFSDDPHVVAQFGKKFMEGLHQEGILATLKHFPGHGNAQNDTHQGTATITKELQACQKVELYPFRQLAKEADLIMTGHLFIPALDPAAIATFSKKILQEYLRGYCQYNGVIISDCLTMKGATPRQETFEESVQSITESSLKAFQAGCDCLLIAGSPQSQKRSYELIQRVHQAFMQAVIAEKISLAQINDSLKRLLALKLKLARSPRSHTIMDQTAVAQEVAKKGLTLISSPSLLAAIPTTLNDKRILLIAPEELKDRILTSFQTLSLHPAFLAYSKANLEKLNEGLLHQQIKQNDLTLFFSYNAPLMPGQDVLMQKVARSADRTEKVIFIGLKNPYDLLELHLHHKFLVYLTYSPTSVSLVELLKNLNQHKRPAGKLPIKFKQMP